jgi:hypothetical protein
VVVVVVVTSSTPAKDFTANFERVPLPIPLYGVIVSSIVGWSIPSIIGWIKAKRQGARVDHYYKRISCLYNDGKLDENDIEPLDRLKRDITDAYAKGKIGDQHYANLKNEISMLYEKIYKKRIDSLNGKGDLDAVKNDITSAYAEGKINELHYNLINEKISDYENNHESIDKKLSSQKIAKSTTQGSPIKTNK